MVILVAFVGLRILGGLGMYDRMPSWAAEITFSLLSQVLLMTIVPIVGILIYRKKFLRKEPKSFAEFTINPNESSGTKEILSSWWFKKPSAQILGWSLVLGIFCFLFNIFVSSFFNGILASFGHRGASGGGGDIDGTYATIGAFIVAMVLIAVLPGICEEITHRGLLMRGFASRVGILRAIMLSSVLFGLMHLNVVQAFYAMILGYLMALAVMATRNIWPAIIIHFMNNGFAVYFTFASARGWFMGDFFTHLGNFFGNSVFLVYIGSFVGLYLLIIAVIHKLARDKFIKDNAKFEEPRRLHRSRGMSAIKYYITADENKNREPLSGIEKTLIYGIVFLGTVVTAMTLVWGFL